MHNPLLVVIIVDMSVTEDRLETGLVMFTPRISAL